MSVVNTLALPPTGPYGHYTLVPDHYISPDNARNLLVFALVASAVMVALPLLAWGTWFALRAGWRNWQAMQRAAEATQELPIVEDIPQWGGVYIPPLPDPIAEHADRLAAFAGPTYRYPCVTDAEWDTAVHHFRADYDAWRRTS